MLANKLVRTYPIPMFRTSDISDDIIPSRDALSFQSFNNVFDDFKMKASNFVCCAD